MELNNFLNLNLDEKEQFISKTFGIKNDNKVEIVLDQFINDVLIFKISDQGKESFFELGYDETEQTYFKNEIQLVAESGLYYGTNESSGLRDFNEVLDVQVDYSKFLVKDDKVLFFK